MDSPVAERHVAPAPHCARSYSAITVFCAVVLLAALLAPGSAVWGHAFEFTEADVLIGGDGTITANVPFHIDAMLAGVPVGEPTDEDYARLRQLPSAEFQRRLDELTEYLRTSVRLKFDGAAIEPAIYFPEMEAQRAQGVEKPMPGQVFVLKAKIPEGAAEFVFTASPIYRMVFMRLFDGDTQTPRREEPINPGADSIPYNLRVAAPPQGVATVVLKYTELGFLHIVPGGLDHILFVLGLFLLSVNTRSLLLQVTAFTVAHTVTLALASLGAMNLPASIVEPLIALSIAYVAIENCATSELTPWRPAVVFGFGLVHGLGFAGVLGELGLPEGRFLSALVSFNVGVELGQLAVIAAAFAIIGWFRRKAWYRIRIAVPLSLAIAVVALIWTVQRVLG